MSGIRYADDWRMAFFDFLDDRKRLAKWVAKTFRQVQEHDPNTPVRDIIAFVVAYRCRRLPPSAHQSAILERSLPRATDIFSLCHVLADVELLSHLSDYEQLTMQMGGTNIAFHTYDVIDRELVRLGFTHDTAKSCS